MATTSPATLSKSTGGGGTNWGSILATYGPAALEALSSYSAGRANNRATDAQIDALDEAGQLQYQTALQAMEMARLRDIQTRLDTEQPRYQGYNAMRSIAQQLGLPVYDQPFNRTLDAFRAGGGTGGGMGGGGGAPIGGVNPVGIRQPGAGTGAAIGNVIGSYFGGSAGGAAGSFIGQGAEDQGYNLAALVDPTGSSGNFFTDKGGNKYLNALVEPNVRNLIKQIPFLGDMAFGDGGDLKTGSRVYANSNGVFFDQGGNVIARVQKPTSGQVAVPGLSRNGNPIFLTSEGRIVKQQQSGGGFDDLGFNINDATQGPMEVNKIIAKGYNPQPATNADYGILPGESQGTGLMQDGAPPPALPTGRYGGFEQTPGYQFVLDEGLRARDKMAASRGRYFSGGTGRELERYAQGVASQEYDNYFRRLMDQVTGGNSATQITTQAGDNATRSAIGSLTGGADQLGSALVAAGSARGSGILAGQQITNSGVAGIAGSGIFDRLGSIFGGSGSKQGGGTATPSAGGRKSPLGGYNSQGYTLDMMRAYGA